MPVFYRRLSAAAMLAGFLAVAAPAEASLFDAETFTLDNGLQVVVIPNHRIPVVTHTIWYKVGAADEPTGKSGIAHFLEHLMFKGTEIRAPGEFSRVVARHGGRDNAFTSQDFTGYTQTIAVEHLELVMEMESDRMANLVLTPAEVDPEREVVLEERRQVVENNPGSLLYEQSRAALFLNHPYRLPVIGWEHEIRGLTLEDAKDFYRAHYAPNNAVLVLSGAVTAEELRPLAEKHYGPIPAREVEPRLRPQEPPQRVARRVTLQRPDVRQPSWSRAYLAPSYMAGETEHAYPLQVLAEVFGGAASSRLYRSLVMEQELATGAGASYSPTSVDLGTFGVFASPRVGVDLADLEAAIEAELQRLLTEGVTAEEVERAKTRMQTATVYALDGLGAAGRIFGTALVIGQSVEDIEAWPERIGAVTADQVNAAARAVLRPEQSVTSILLPDPTS